MTPLTFPTTEHYDYLNRYHVEFYVNFHDMTSLLYAPTDVDFHVDFVVFLDS